jgi:predicted DNA-binding transcriptional regulator AlpA
MTLKTKRTARTDATPVLISDKDGAIMIGCSPATWWRRVSDGTLPQPIKIGGLTRWRRDEILAAIEDASAKRTLGAKR